MTALVLSGLGYLVAINAFLYFDGISLLFKTTNTVNATYDSAYSIWPGVVHATRFRVVFQDKNLQFSLEVQKLTARIALSELLHRRFHVKSVTGSGAAFRMRHRIEPESRGLPWVSALPPIHEFPAPAVFEPTVPEPPIPDSKYNLWTVHLENVNVGVDEVWIQFVRFTGVARAQGAFRLVPARTLWVGPASLALEQGQLRLGREAISSQLRGRISCGVDFFDVRIPQGREVFRFINTDLALHADGFLPDAFAQFFVPASTRVSSKPGKLDVNLHVRQGTLRSDSTTQYSTEAFTVQHSAMFFDIRQPRILCEMPDTNTILVRFEADGGSIGHESAILIERVTGSVVSLGSDLTRDFELASKKLAIGGLLVEDATKLNSMLPKSVPVVLEEGTVRASLAASDANGQRSVEVQVSRTTIRLRHANVSVQFDGAFALAAKSRDSTPAAVWVHASANLKHSVLTRAANARSPFTVELSSLFANGTYKTAESGANLDFVASIGAISTAAVSHSGTRVLAQNLRAKGALARVADRIDAKSEITLDLLQLRTKKVLLSIRPTVRLNLANFDEKRGSGKVNASVAFAGWNATYGDDAGQCSSLAIPSAKFEASALFASHGLQGTLNGSLERVELSWGSEFRASGNLILGSRWSGRGPGMVGTGEFSARLLHAALVSGKDGNSGWQVGIPEVRINGRTARKGEIAGSFDIEAVDATGRIGGTQVKGSMQAEVRHIVLDPTRSAAVVDAQLRMRDVRLRAGVQSIDQWWAVVDMPAAELIARENLELAANFRASLRDATPGLILLAQGGVLPTWLSGALPLNAMSVGGQIARRCRVTTIRFDEATGGPLRAQGTLQSTADLVRGAFLVRLAALQPVSAGIAVGPPDAGVSLLVGNEWLRRQTDRLNNAARQMLSLPCAPDPQRCANSSVTAARKP